MRWRRSRDSNPSCRLSRQNGFRDRRIRPLCHSSAGVLAPDLVGKIKNGGETGIRTLDTLLAYTRFPIVLLRPARTSLRSRMRATSWRRDKVYQHCFAVASNESNSTKLSKRHGQALRTMPQKGAAQGRPEVLSFRVRSPKRQTRLKQKRRSSPPHRWKLRFPSWRFPRWKQPHQSSLQRHWKQPHLHLRKRRFQR